LDLCSCIPTTKEGTEMDGESEINTDTTSILAELLVRGGVLLDAPLCVGDILRRD